MADDTNSESPQDHEELGNWDYLPHDPMSFFALREGFDRRELKRAYGILIRKYKPETHPAEFQRIRIAFERLENNDRYGPALRLDPTASPNDRWSVEQPVKPRKPQASSAVPRSTEPGGVRSPHLKSASIFEVAIASPNETYSRLRDKNPRTPQEYYALAVLSDLVENPTDRRKFLEWLLLAVEASNSDPGILALISDYLRFDVETKDAPSILLSIAQRLKSPLFYRLSEKLWERFIRESDFDIFAPLLAECELLIRQTHPRSRFAFYLRILRTAIWKAPSAWIDQQLDRLEQESVEMDEASQLDLELISLLQAYLESSSQLAFASSTRRKIDAILKAYCDQDNPHSIATIFIALNDLAHDSDGLSQTFPFSQDSNESCVFVLLSIIANEFSELFPNASNAAEASLDRLTEMALGDIRNSITSVTWETREIAFPYTWLVFFPMLLVWSLLTIPLVLPLSGIGKNGALLAVCMFIASIFICFLVFFFHIYPKRLKHIVDSKTEAFLRHIYEERWRERLFCYLKSSGEPYATAMMRLQRMAWTNTGFWEKVDERWVELIMAYSKKDIGLQIFARCQRFTM